MPIPYKKETGILAAGPINTFISGSTGTLTTPFSSSGYGEIVGLFFNSGSGYYGLAPHSPTHLTSPGSTGTIYYNTLPQFGGSGVQLKFVITAFSGDSVYTGDMDDNGSFYGDSFIVGLNNSGYSGLYHPAIPSGYLMHKETSYLLPNYGVATTGVFTGVNAYSIQAGGIYPSMLRDNILSINIQMTWSGSCGDAVDC